MFIDSWMEMQDTKVSAFKTDTMRNIRNHIKSHFAQLVMVSEKEVECASTFEDTKEMVQIDHFYLSVMMPQNERNSESAFYILNYHMKCLMRVYAAMLKI